MTGFLAKSYEYMAVVGIITLSLCSKVIVWCIFSCNYIRVDFQQHRCGLRRHFLVPLQDASST